MKIRAGYAIGYECLQATPMILCLSVHPSRRPALITPDRMRLHPDLPTTAYRDGFDNICHVVNAPLGQMTISADFLVEDSGEPDDVAPAGGYHALDELPVETLAFLLGSRYCETDRLSDFAWSTFGNVSKGGTLVQAICDFVHTEVEFGYQHANPTRTAFDTFNERRGVCRDFAHLAITLCRCMNIPARYCTGYLGDIGIPSDQSPMDFSAWFEAYLNGRWYTFDARHNTRRIGRILIAQGRDATDVAVVTSFGSHNLISFNVIAEELAEDHAKTPSSQAFV